MAFVPSKLPEDEQNKFAPTGSTTPVPDQSGGSVGSASPGTGSVSPASATSTQFGSDASKLSDYLSTNAPQIEAQGQKIAGDLNNQFSGIQGDIDQGVQGFNGQVAGGWAAPDQGIIDQAAKDPTSFAKDPNNVSKFKSQYNNTYTGPQNFESSKPYADLNSKVNEAVQNTGLINSPSGVGAYLQKANGTNATPGMQTLDTALLMGNPTAYGNVKSAADKFSNLTSYLGDQTNKIDAAVANAKTGADTARSAAQTRFTGSNGVVPAFQADLDSRLASARGSAQSKEDKLLQDLFNGGSATPQPALTQDDLDLLTSKENQAQIPTIFDSVNALHNDYGQDVDLHPYITSQNPSVAYGDANTVANSDDYDRAAALSTLLGGDFNSPLDPSQSGNAGKYNPNLVSFDLPGAQGATTQSLRSQDLNFLGRIQNSSGKPIMEILSQPGGIAAARAQFSGNDLKTFDNVIQRLGLNNLQSGTTKPTQPHLGIPGGPETSRGSLGFGGTPGIF